MTAPVVSVLIPSRGRPQQLEACIRQLFRLAADMHHIELLLRLDFDDHETIELFRRLRGQYRLTAVIDAGYNGWPDNHRFYNDLARQSTGRWLLMYNDDAQMLTQHWDKKIRLAPKPIAATRMRKYNKAPPHRWQAQNGQNMSNAFPAVRRDAYEALGVFSRHRHSDVFWEWLAAPIGIQQAIDVDIVHQPSRSLERSPGGGWWQDFQADPLRSQLQRDRERLAKLKDVL